MHNPGFFHAQQSEEKAESTGDQLALLSDLWDLKGKCAVAKHVIWDKLNVYR